MRRHHTNPLLLRYIRVYTPYMCILNMIYVIHVLCCVLVDLREGCWGNLIKFNFYIKELNGFSLEVLVQTPHKPHTKFDGNPFTNSEDE
jgi:hypothetical protein